MVLLVFVWFFMKYLWIFVYLLCLMGKKIYLFVLIGLVLRLVLNCVVILMVVVLGVSKLIVVSLNCVCFEKSSKFFVKGIVCFRIDIWLFEIVILIGLLLIIVSIVCLNKLYVLNLFDFDKIMFLLYSIFKWFLWKKILVSVKLFVVKLGNGFELLLFILCFF